MRLCKSPPLRGLFLFRTAFSYPRAHRRPFNSYALTTEWRAIHMRRFSTALAALGVVGALSAGVALAATQAAPSNTTAPAISGTPTVGQTLTASDGTWT